MPPVLLVLPAVAPPLEKKPPNRRDDCPGSQEGSHASAPTPAPPKVMLVLTRDLHRLVLPLRPGSGFVTVAKMKAKSCLGSRTVYSSPFLPGLKENLQLSDSKSKHLEGPLPPHAIVFFPSC